MSSWKFTQGRTDDQYTIVTEPFSNERVTLLMQHKYEKGTGKDAEEVMNTVLTHLDADDADALAAALHGAAKACRRGGR